MADEPTNTDPSTSRRMAGIRQKGTKAELFVRSVLRSLGVGYRLNVKKLPGSPDIANRSRKFAILVHGCFWHHHRACKRASVPKRNEAFWQAKFSANRERDAAAIRSLRRLGYQVAVVWECETLHAGRLRDHLLRLVASEMRKSR